MTQNQSLKTRRLGKYSDPKFVLTFNGKPISSSTTVEEGENGLVVNIDIEALAKALGARTGATGIDREALAAEIEELGLLTSERLRAVLETYSNDAGGLNCSGSEVALDANAVGKIAEKVTDMLIKDLEGSAYIKGLAKASDIADMRKEIASLKTEAKNAVDGVGRVVTDGLNRIDSKLQGQGETDLKKVREAVKAELGNQENGFAAIQVATKRGVANYFDENKNNNSFAKAIATGIVKDNTMATSIATHVAKECVTNENTGRERLSLFFMSLVLSIMAVMFTFLAVTLNQSFIIWCFVLTTISLLISFFTGATVYFTEMKNGMQRPTEPSVSWAGAVVNIGIAVALFITVIVALATH